MRYLAFVVLALVAGFGIAQAQEGSVSYEITQAQVDDLKAQLQHARDDLDAAEAVLNGLPEIQPPPDPTPDPDPPPPDPEPVDYIVTMSIADGATISEPTVWEVNVTGEPVDRVMFYVDGTFQHTEGLVPYRFGGDSSAFDPADFGPGSHTLEARVFDEQAATEPVEVASVSITIPAAPAPDPDPDPQPDPDPPSADIQIGTELYPYGATPGNWLYVGDGPDVPLDPSSNSYVGQLTNTLASNYAILTYSGETPPVYIAKASDPVYTVRISGHPLNGEQLHAPAGIVPGSGSDHPLIVLDPTTKTEYRFWQAQVGSGIISASSGGMFDYGPNGNGRAFKGNGVGSGLSYLNGMIRRAEFQRYLDGEVPIEDAIPHALRFSGNFIGGTYRFPATRTDQSGGGIPMGLRYYLNLTAAECNQRTAPAGGASTELARAICHALRKHGMYAADGSGAGLNLYLENDITGDWSSILGGNKNQIIRGPGSLGAGSSTDGIPWDRMVVRADTGQTY